MDSEYEIEHFGFSAEQMSLERKYFIKKILNNAFDVVLNKIDSSQETSKLLLQQKEDIFRNVLGSIGEHISRADDLDRKYFSIPEHVLLPPYFDHVTVYTESDEKQLDAQLELHKKTFLENSVMLASVKMENSRYKNLAKFVDDEVSVQQQLKQSFNSINIKEIQTLVDKACSFRV